MSRIRVSASIVGLLVIVLVVLSACSGGGSGSTGSKGKVTLDIVVNNSSRNIPEGFTAEDNPYVNYVKENTGLDVKFNYPPADAYLERLNIIMSSGDLPDLLHTGDPAWVVRYINQNALQPLNDAIEAHGPNLKKVISPEAWANVTVDGKIYAVPSQSEVSANFLMYIRKDWLDNLNLDIPTTLEEYEEVLRAFVEDDPDQNGKGDTIGLVITENLGKTAPIFGAFGTVVEQNQWYERDGQLVNSRTIPETKAALELLARWYADGLIDSEFALNKLANFEEKIANGTAGIFAANWFDTRGPILTNKQNDPNAEWIPIDLPVGPDGKKGTLGNTIVSSYSVVPSTSKHVNEVIQWLNFIADEGYQSLKLGFEDEIWTMEDGVMVTNFEEHNKHIYRQTIHQVADSNTKEVRELRLNSLGLEFNLIDNINRIEPYGIHSEFLGMPTPAMGRYGASLDMMFYEMATKVVMGNEPIDAFDRFVEEWKAQGGDEMAKEANEWYATQK